MQRVSIVGNARSGKSRLARRIAERLNLAYVELDAIHHLANAASITEPLARSWPSYPVSPSCLAFDGRRYSIDAMSWGKVELEPEVRDWYLALDEEDQARVGFHVDRLAEMGPLLDEPFTKQLDGKLRELQFYLGGRPTRITYWIASNRRIILLTVFVKTRQRERREVDRARRAYQQCVAERHTLEES